MIFVVSAARTAEESALLEDVIPVPEPEFPFPLLNETSAEELDSVTDEDGTESEELDSSIALLSVFSRAELLASSPQAINSVAAVIRTIFPKHLLKSFAIF